MAKNDKPSLKPKKYNNQKNALKIPQFNRKHIPKLKISSLSNINIENLRKFNLNNILGLNKKYLLIICIIILLLIMIFTIHPNKEIVNDNTTETEQIKPTSIMLGNNSLGYVVKEGPYGNTSSNVKIAYILGVHPREKGAHRLKSYSLT